jgi:hypothetical protein
MSPEERSGLQFEIRRLSSVTPPSPSKSQSLCKIQNQKREEKSQEDQHQESNPGLPTFKSEALPRVQLPTPLQGAPHECRSSTIFSVLDSNSFFFSFLAVGSIHF